MLLIKFGNIPFFITFASNIHIIMINKPLLLLGLSVAMVGAGMTASGAEPVSLTFNRTGASASEVTVTVNGAPGANATLKSMSHDMKTSGSAITSSILCPNVNGNTSPTITFDLTVSGLPSGFSFDNVGLDIHALNGTGAYQESSDGVDRRWNVSISVNNQEFASLTDIDIAAGINPGGDRHKVWDAAGSTTAATSPLDITLTVTSGSANGGCFFGLSEITLSTGNGEEPTPPTPPENEGKIYTIKWKNNTSSYMCEAADGGIVINNYSTDKLIFWELIPTEKENCYYIRNCVSGLYIGSCNMNPSSASKVKMSATPVEYYVHKSASTSGENKGCWWMSSTDCANYDKETSGARCLNKDGASSSIITWTTGLTNIGSYWTLTESANLYEVHPFKATTEIGSPQTLYQILRNADDMALTHSLAWATPSQTDPEQKWYFVGSSNAQGGYQIVNASTDTPLNSTSYTVHENKNGGFSFVNTVGDTLMLGGTKTVRFNALRSELTRALGIYNLPCGSTGNYWVSNITSEACGFSYPLPVRSGNSISHPSVTTKPSNKYTIVTRDRLVIDNTTLNITLNKEPGDDLKMALYFDADGDGIFEEAMPLTPAKKISQQVQIKGMDGKRMRLRLTTNGLMGAEDDVIGQVIDIVLRSMTPHLDCFCMPTVSVNAPERGTATVNDDDETINATPKGTSTFICWMIGHRYVSTDATLHVKPSDTPEHYTAIFSPNLNALTGIVPAILANKAMGVEMTIGADKTVRVVSKKPVRHLVVFSTDGSLADTESGTDHIALGHLPAGIYVVKAVTDSGTATLKIAI